MTSIDLEKAFDRVPREKIWESLQIRDVSNKLKSAVKSLYRNNNNYVISQNCKSKYFITTEGVRQGGVLSPLLFMIFLDHIVKKANQQINCTLDIGT